MSNPSSPPEENEKIRALTLRVEKAERLAHRYIQKIHNLVWKENLEGEKICRHCGEAYPEHTPSCLASNITILKNP